MLGDLLRELLSGGAAKPMMKKGFAKGAKYEDEAFVGSPRNLNQFSPINADVRNFQMRPQGRYEDEALMAGQQGFSPISADVANFRNPRNYNQQRNTNPMLQYGNLQGGGLPQEFRNRLRVR
jgi:hypothetical protein